MKGIKSHYVQQTIYCSKLIDQDIERTTYNRECKKALHSKSLTAFQKTKKERDRERQTEREKETDRDRERAKFKRN